MKNLVKLREGPFNEFYVVWVRIKTHVMKGVLGWGLRFIVSNQMHDLHKDEGKGGGTMGSSPCNRVRYDAKPPRRELRGSTKPESRNLR